MTEQPTPFFLIVADHDREFFCVEGPMIDNRPWKDAAMNARNNECGPSGPAVTRSPPDTDAPTNSTAFRRAAS
jgi:hypothetical protein